MHALLQLLLGGKAASNDGSEAALSAVRLHTCKAEPVAAPTAARQLRASAGYRSAKPGATAKYAEHPGRSHTTSGPSHRCRLRHILTAALALLSVLSCFYAFTACKPKPGGQLALGGGGGGGREQGGIYVWDPAAELPGLPPCDQVDPTSYLPVVRRLVLRRFPKLAECHEEYQYASAWYFERALLRAHGQLARSVESADAVLIASSCFYEAAFWSRSERGREGCVGFGLREEEGGSAGHAAMQAVHVQAAGTLIDGKCVGLHRGAQGCTALPRGRVRQQAAAACVQLAGAWRQHHTWPAPPCSGQQQVHIQVGAAGPGAT